MRQARLSLLNGSRDSNNMKDFPQTSPRKGAEESAKSKAPPLPSEDQLKRRQAPHNEGPQDQSSRHGEQRKGLLSCILLAAQSSLALLLCRLAVGGSLLLASTLKMRSPKAFALSIDAFGMVPTSWVAALAFFFIWQEIVAGACLALGVFSRAAALVAIGLLAAFTGALAWAVLSGMTISCGCFGALGQGPVGWPSLARNAALICAAAWVLRRGGGRWAIDSLFPK